MINFKTYTHLSKDIKRSLSAIPADISLIVGVPRSGMVPAYMIGGFLNLPVMTIDDFIDEKKSSHGYRDIRKNGNKVLIVDDSINTGDSLKLTKEKLKNKYGEKYDNLVFYVVYATEKSKSSVDIYASICDHPRLFQWNYMYHGLLKNACVDIDGVLCVDPTDEQNDDGEKYIEFLQSARPLCPTNYPIRALVTSRLEKYREQTETWLEKEGIVYEELYMLNLPNKEERIKMGAYAKFKSSIYAQLHDTIVFIESSRSQAEEITKLTGKPAICFETDELFLAEDESKYDSKLHRISSLLNRSIRSPWKIMTFPYNLLRILFS